MQPQVIYVGGLAGLMGTSEAAIRSHIQRRSWPTAIPLPFRLGRKWAWKMEDVQDWLAGKSGDSKDNKVGRRGRPPKAVSVLQGRRVTP